MPHMPDDAVIGDVESQDPTCPVKVTVEPSGASTPCLTPSFSLTSSPQDSLLLGGGEFISPLLFNNTCGEIHKCCS
jgi:hypothetical protein